MTGCEDAARACGVVLRGATDADLPFMTELYISLRADEVAQTGWPDEAQRAFLVAQHMAQHDHYTRHYVGAERSIIERDGVPIGRLYLSEGASDLRIVDIALMPHARGGGLGGALLTAVLARAAGSGKTASIHVEKTNPARRLYERLGFSVIDADRGPYDLMEWRSPAAA